MLLKAHKTGTLSDEALTRIRRPLLVCDWARTIMIHYEVDPEHLQPLVPYELDTRDGKAYVSLVAFTMRGMRPQIGGRMAAWMLAPMSTHGFLNVRTYVKHQGESGIYFLAEWLPNRMAVILGPRTFGLPYRPGKLEYRHEHERGRIRGSVLSYDGAGRLEYRAGVDLDASYGPCEEGSLDEFLMERYTAFTRQGNIRRKFRVWHEPWPQTPVDVELLDESLVAATGSWFEHARCIGANYSPGAFDVWMGRPVWIPKRSLT